jgi:hypothetical protein
MINLLDYLLNFFEKSSKYSGLTSNQYIKIEVNYEILQTVNNIFIDIINSQPQQASTDCNLFNSPDLLEKNQFNLVKKINQQITINHQIDLISNQIDTLKTSTISHF